jgi:hypothetical protein
MDETADSLERRSDEVHTGCEARGSSPALSEQTRLKPADEHGATAVDADREESVFDDGPTLLQALGEHPAITMAPFVAWSPHALPDPRTASFDDIAAGLIEIVRAEGPMLCQRAYRLYAETFPGQELNRQTRSIFSKAMYRAVQQGQLLATDELYEPGMLQQVVRPIGCPKVVLRERGERLLGEIPPFELAALLRALDGGDETLHDDQEALFTQALSLLGLERRRESDWQTDILSRAYELLDRVPDEATQIGLFEAQS